MPKTINERLCLICGSSMVHKRPDALYCYTALYQDGRIILRQKRCNILPSMKVVRGIFRVLKRSIAFPTGTADLFGVPNLSHLTLGGFNDTEIE